MGALRRAGGGAASAGAAAGLGARSRPMAARRERSRNDGAASIASCSRSCAKAQTQTQTTQLAMDCSGATAHAFCGSLQVGRQGLSPHALVQVGQPGSDEDTATHRRSAQCLTCAFRADWRAPRRTRLSRPCSRCRWSGLPAPSQLPGARQAASSCARTAVFFDKVLELFHGPAALPRVARRAERQAEARHGGRRCGRSTRSHECSRRLVGNLRTLMAPFSVPAT
jgi:hypothetical protein